MEDEDEAWTVPDVCLLTAGSDGPIAVPHLRLTFREGGLELDKADGEMVWDCDWSDLVEMAPMERSVLPDGEDGVVVVVVEGRDRRRHRFVLATDDADAPAATGCAPGGPVRLSHGCSRSLSWPRSRSR